FHLLLKQVTNHDQSGKNILFAPLICHGISESRLSIHLARTFYIFSGIWLAHAEIEDSGPHVWL
ncbi:hypothetical protein ACJX0J_011504, partial [Zea mays]